MDYGLQSAEFGGPPGAVWKNLFRGAAKGKKF
jgi:hypothetical protein